MNCKAVASLEFLLSLAALLAVVSLYSSFLNSLNSKVASSAFFLEAKTNALDCALGIDSLAANSAFAISSKRFDCFSDSNASVASIIRERKARAFTIRKARVTDSGSGIVLEVEASAHYS